MSDERQDRTHVKRKMYEAYASWYWAMRHKNVPQGFAHGKTKAQRAGFILEYRRYRELLKTAPPETNERGNVIYRDEDAERYLKIHNPIDPYTHMIKHNERYWYDFEALKPAAGWKQYDTKQDAWYFGIWVNIEGDRTLVVCPDDEHLRAELKDMAEFYGDPPPAFIAYTEESKGQWVRQEFYDTRPSV